MPRPAHWGFWATILWGVGIALIFTLAQSIAVIVAVVLRTANLAEPDFVQQLAAIEKDGTVLSIATYCSTIICCGAIAVAVAAKRGATLRDYLCLNPVSIRAAVLWIGGLVVLLVLLDLLTGALNKPIVPDFVAPFTSGQSRVDDLDRYGDRRAAVRETFFAASVQGFRPPL
jgi:hypothetical protein